MSSERAARAAARLAMCGLVLLCAIAVIGGVAYGNGGGTLWVDDDWAGTTNGDPVGDGKIFGIDAFAHPQDAVNAATPGDTIEVYPGTYGSRVFTGPGHWGPNDQYAPALIVYKDNLEIRAVDPDPANTIIESTHLFWSNPVAVQASTGGIWKQTGTQPWQGHYEGAGVNPSSGTAPNGVALISSGSVIEGFTLKATINQNVAPIMVGGLYAGDPAFLGADGNTIQNNIMRDSWTGLYVWHSSDNLIQGNEIHDVAWRAVQIYDGYNDTQIGLGYHSQRNQFVENEVYNAWGGLFVGAWPPTTLPDNSSTVVTDNYFHDLTDFGVSFAYTDSSNMEVSGNTLERTLGGIMAISNALLNNTILDGNVVIDPVGAGIQLHNMDGIEISGQDVGGLASWWAVFLLDSEDVHIVGSDVSGNAGGIAMVNCSDGFVEFNTIHNNSGAGINISSAAAETIRIRFNSIVGNTVGVENWDPGTTLDASLNWWGSGEGPWSPTNAAGLGEAIWFPNVIYSPWLGIDPDDDAGSIGVQLASPMLFIVDDVGPMPPLGYLGTAIDAANNLTGEDSIEVREGVYRPGPSITDPVFMYGLPGAAIDGTGIGGTGVNVDTGHVTLDGIEVRNVSDGVLAYMGSDYATDWTGLVLTNNTIHATTGGGGGASGFGLYVGTESERFWLPTPPWGMAGLDHLLDLTGLRIEGNEIYGTTICALTLQSVTAASGTLDVTGNHIHDVGWDAIWIDSSSKIKVEGNDLLNCDDGVFVSAYSDGYYEGVPNQPFDTRDVLILKNNIAGNSVYGGVVVYDGWPSTIDVHLNRIVGNSIGILNWVGGGDIDASLNWWGAASGPSGEGIGTGDAVSTDVIFSPWLGTDPDGDAGTVGVQITGPMTIIVAPAGPEPAGGYLNAAIAGANSADLPYIDTIEVQHGTYDASTPITQGATVLSEPGSALHTTLNGNMGIDSNNVLVGLPLQGFRINGNVTVGAGKDASTSAINWCDLYGSVTNGGTGTFNARYNYWGTQEYSVIDARTFGDVDVYPYLPENADQSYQDILALFSAGTAGNVDGAIEQLHFMVQQGQNVGQLIKYLAAAGAGVFQHLPTKARMALGRAAGGGGGIGTTGGGTHTVGDIIEDVVLLTDPATEEPITDAAVTLSLMDADGNLVYWGCATYDEETGEYVYSIDTAGMAPGTYSLIIQSDDGQSQTVMVEVEAA